MFGNLKKVVPDYTNYRAQALICSHLLFNIYLSFAVENVTQYFFSRKELTVSISNSEVDTEDFTLIPFRYIKDVFKL